MAEIICENRNTGRSINIQAFKRVAVKVMEHIGRPKAGLNIIFVSNQKIRALNRKYLGRDNATDVIAFREDDAPRDVVKTPDFLGDIAISSDKAAQNALEYGVSFKDELVLYVIHGILHLAGYEDGTKKDRELMKREEHVIFEKIRPHI